MKDARHFWQNRAVSQLEDVDLRNRWVFAFVAIVGFFACGQAAYADQALQLNADKVTFYYDRFLIEADGNVTVDLGNGVTMSGQTFSMDLRLNRFLVAGNVVVTSPSGTLHGAAAANFLTFKRVYFIPVSTEPDRWTYLDGDFAHPQKGREMPGDAFFFPDVSQTPVFLIAHHATIMPNSYALFRPASLNSGVAYVPLPSFYLNFSSNPNLAQNSLSGATADITYPFMGTNNAITAVHARWDVINRFYYSFEQHLATQKTYAVFSVNPASRPSKFFNVLLSDRFSDRSQFQTFTQVHTFQSGLSMPLESSQFTNATYTQALGHSYVQLSANFFNQSLLANPGPSGFFSDPSHTFNAAHPFNGQIAITGFDHRIGKLPVYERLRYGLFYAHDQYGIQTYATPGTSQQQCPVQQPNCNASFPPYGVGRTLWQNFAGLTLYTPAFKVAKDTYLNGVYDKQRQWGPPHYVDTTNATFSLSRVFGSRVALYSAYNVQNVQDIYGASQILAYPSYAPDGYPGFLAFRGLATYRTLSGSFTFTPNPDMAFSTTLRKHTDFPAPIPFYYGQPPYDLSADLRIRVRPHMMLDISRTYYFNFANRAWNDITVQVLP